MTTTFESLGLSADLVDALSAAGITHPFPIQSLTIPDALDPDHGGVPAGHAELADFLILVGTGGDGDLMGRAARLVDFRAAVSILEELNPVGPSSR